MSNVPAAITSASALTTAAKNAFDIVEVMSCNRKQKKMITTMQVRQLEAAVNTAIVKARMNGLHSLEEEARRLLKESVSQIGEYRNTELGDMFLEMAKDEFYHLKELIDEYMRFTRYGDIL